MYTAKITMNFAAAHFLADYHGKCENLHGHNYRVEASVRGAVLDGGGMLLDFSVLKGKLREVLEKLDHSLLNDEPFFANNPSAERIAFYIHERLAPRVAPLFLSAVAVWETDQNCAVYEADDQPGS
jgi:6-pyruvoyltetrahydropterin/6-carboxytetrahydropterin synthase